MEIFTYPITRQCYNYDKNRVHFDRAMILLPYSGYNTLQKLRVAHTGIGLAAAGETFIRMLTWPETRSRIAKIVERGFQKPGDFELRLVQYK